VGAEGISYGVFLLHYRVGKASSHVASERVPLYSLRTLFHTNEQVRPLPIDDFALDETNIQAVDFRYAGNSPSCTAGDKTSPYPANHMWVRV